jgi:replicative DNA helicase
VQRLEQDDPEMHALIVQDEQLERETLNVADQLRHAPNAEREKVTKTLSELVNKHFDVRQARRELQLKRMEDELKRLRDAIAKRNEERQAIVDRRLSELVGDPKDLEF